ELLGQMRQVGKLHKPQVEQAGFAVLRSPEIPSVLVESAFISNPLEESLLNTPEYQDALVQALHQGVLGFFRRHPIRV
ncbi:MAG: N-acetylmuramoyl-L-alanine amidase, partial [Betaproteobacteria bacterium]|nr:N-acetylmuramoyl-L-alanine amidase [Betaproteobacteria bacterium]